MNREVLNIGMMKKMKKLFFYYGNMIQNDRRITNLTLHFFFGKSGCFLAASLLAAAAAFPFRGISVFLGFPADFGGEAANNAVFGKWLLISCIPIVLNGYALEEGRRIDNSLKIRLRTKKDFLRIYAWCGGKITIIWVGYLALFTAFETGIRNVVLAFPMVLSGLFLLQMLQMVLFFRISAKQAGGTSGVLTILLNGGLCLTGIKNPEISSFLPPFWTMLSRNHPSDDPVRYVISLILNLLFSTLLMKVLRDKE